MNPPTASELAPFADPAVVDAAVAELIAQRPRRNWKATDLVAGCGHPMVDTMMSLARLTASGFVKRTAPGRYRARDSGSDVPDP